MYSILITKLCFVTLRWNHLKIGYETQWGKISWWWNNRLSLQFSFFRELIFEQFTTGTILFWRDLSKFLQTGSAEWNFPGFRKTERFLFSPVLMHHIFHKIERKKSCEQNFINQNILEIQNLGFWFYTINLVKCRKPSSRNASAIIFYLQVHILPWEECVHAKSLQSCPTLCNLMDCSPPGFSVHGDFSRSGLSALLQGIFLTQGSNLRQFCLLCWQVGSLPLVPPGKSLGGELLHFLTIITISLWNPSCCWGPACLSISFNVKSVTRSEPEIVLQKKIY